MGAWNGWYHVNGNTYGTWLPGDKRGWRSRHHKVHVDGDYKAPPPVGKYDELRRRAEAAMPQPPVFLDQQQRELAGPALVEMLLQQEAELLALSLDAVHFHLLARFGQVPPRPVIGRAKKHAYHILHDAGHTGSAWAKRCRVLPITDRAHQVNVFDYILRHGENGAWTWSFKSAEGRR